MVIGLSLLAFLTSTLTGILGLGGGLILIAIMPGFVPPSVLIPIHAVVQLASNSSRAMFSSRDIRWEFVGAFLLGSILGGMLGMQFIRLINLDYITLVVAAFILLSVWAPQLLTALSSKRGEMFSVGFIQTGLGTMGGTTGPLTNANLARLGASRDQVVSTVAVQMSITHLIKVMTFAWIGVNILVWWKLMLGMSIGVVLGSWLGTHTRAKLNEVLFRKIMNTVLTVLALRMIYITL